MSLSDSFKYFSEFENNTKYPTVISKELREGNYNKNLCGAADRYAKIDMNGDIFLCDKQFIGNLYGERLDQIFNGKNANNIRKVLIEEKNICKKCDFFNFCVYRISLNDMESVKNAPFAFSPIHLESFGEYNIIHFGFKYYAINKPFDSRYFFELKVNGEEALFVSWQQKIIKKFFSNYKAIYKVFLKK